MKKLSIVLLSAGLLIYGCKQKDAALTQTSACPTCKIEVADFQKTISINSLKVNFDFWKGGSKRLADKNYAVGISQGNPVSSDDINRVLNFLNIKIDNLSVSKGDIISCALYQTDDMAELTSDNCAGVALMYIKDSKMNVCIFNKINGQYTMVDGLNKQVSSLRMNDFYKTGILLVGKNKKINTLLINSNNFTKTEFATIKKQSMGSISYLLDFKLNGNRPFLLSDRAMNSTYGFEVTPMIAHNCDGFPCEGGGEGICDYDGGTAPICDAPCPSEFVSHVGNDQVYSATVNPPIYNFRDNILANSTFGQHMIDEYYYCGTIISSTLTTTVASEAIDVVTNRIVPILNRLSDKNASSDNSVLFQNDDETVIYNFVEDVKALSTDADFVGIMNEVEDNIKYMDGKTVSDVLTDLK